MELATQAAICLQAWAVAKSYSINRALVFPNNNISSRLSIFNPSHLPTLSWPLGFDRDVC